MKQYIILLLAVLGVVSCSKDDMDATEGNFTEVKARVNLVTSDFSQVQTRLSEDEENAWSNVWIAQFDDSGNIVPASVAEHLESEGNFTITLAPCADTKVYFVTNLATNPFVGISTLDDFLASSYSTTDITDGNRLVMVGVWEGAVTGNVGLIDIVVYAKRMTAKVDFVIQTVQPGGNYYIRATKVQLGGVATTMTYGTGSKVTSSADVVTLAECALTKDDAKSSELFYYYTAPTQYMLENMQGTHGSASSDIEKNANAPKDGADDISAYVLVWADICDAMNYGKAVYKIYLGENSFDNFDICRNTHYTVTITINGLGNTTTDIRVDKSNIYNLYFQTKTGSYLSQSINRTTEWDTEEYFEGRVFSGNSTWSYSLISSKGDSAEPYSKIQYSTDNGATWSTPAISGSNIPSEAWFKFVYSKYESGASDRKDILYVSNDEYTPIDPAYRIGYSLTQKPQAGFSIAGAVFVDAAAGVYEVPVLAAGAYGWKFNSLSNANATYVETIDDNGDPVPDGDYLYGSGKVRLSFPQNTTVKSNVATGNIAKNAVTLRLDVTIGGETEVKSLNLWQMYSSDQLHNPLWKYTYSSNALHETIPVAMVLSWTGMDLLGEGQNYAENEGLVGANHLTDGKLNTLTIFNKIDREVGAVVTPAGVCMMLNEDYWDITSSTDPRLQWYLPARYQTQYDAIFHGTLGNTTYKYGGIRDKYYWTSYATDVSLLAHSAYFEGQAIDMTGNFTSTGVNTRCIRNLTPTEKTYPYVANVDGAPIVVLKETVEGVDKGLVETYAANIGKPLRFTVVGDQTGAVDGLGPVMSNYNGTAPKFQVAKEDIVGLTWYEACGWNSTATDVATPNTGCMAYNEGGYSDWRMPTTIELRVIHMLGATTLSREILPNFSYGSTEFSSIPGFNLLEGSYWTSQNFDGSRAYYVGTSTVEPLRFIGTANAKTGTNLNTRCVRTVN